MNDRKPEITVAYFFSLKRGLDIGTMNASIVVLGLMLCWEPTGSFT